MIFDSLKNESDMRSLGMIRPSLRISSKSCILLSSCNTQTRSQVKSKITACLWARQRWGWASSSCLQTCAGGTDAARYNTKNKPWPWIHASPWRQLCQPTVAPLQSHQPAAYGSERSTLARLGSQGRGFLPWWRKVFLSLHKIALSKCFVRSKCTLQLQHSVSPA